MTGRRRVAASAALALATATGSAAADTAHGWISTGLAMEVRTVHVGGWHPEGGKVYVTDALTLAQAEGVALSVPDRRAGVTGYIDSETGHVAALALIWSSDSVVCGVDLMTVGVDTGTLAILTPAAASALAEYAVVHGTTYDGPYAAQLDANMPTVPFIADLPGAPRFPVTGTGWGDGGYPVASLIDAEGDVVALYTQFLGGDEEWLLPPPLRRRDRLTQSSDSASGNVANIRQCRFFR